MGNTEQIPYLTENGELIISSDAPAKYKWWDGGQSVKETLEELAASDEVNKIYLNQIKGLRT